MHSTRVGRGRALVLGGAVRQRVAAASLGKTGDQRLGLGGQEQHLDIVSLLLEPADVGRQLGQRQRAAGVDGDGELFGAVLFPGFDQGPQQRRRQVVHAKITGVFESGQSYRFARARKCR